MCYIVVYYDCHAVVKTCVYIMDISSIYLYPPSKISNISTSLHTKRYNFTCVMNLENILFEKNAIIIENHVIFWFLSGN